ncbi:unnamed protein product [Vitrella brassicaformis CCMP3155]|uniref:COPI associated protein n=1 Tax=Vitrella brassicaformis (strain CCMP3155) TaxID=1169540 RepID=A0A0G4FVR3_VITBC|nr:unnamed protein product [Vitrella brassicaformis CCMP3155]|mmetsp:Transcript_4346/g.9943  ORF Transcript_4346/g.9943 Transcript_4346/m.9943 type:complete len:165 (-) Transcript_4346:206-700(-)|eukprot:CEM18672.1 unnamed protein product [Vitrella brassicaformis CCMP3155]
MKGSTASVSPMVGPGRSPSLEACLCYLLHAISILTALLIIGNGLLVIVWYVWGPVLFFVNWVVAVALLFFGGLLLAADLKCVERMGYFPFLYSSVGRGLFIILCGLLSVDLSTLFGIAAGGLITVLGVVYCLLGGCWLQGCPKPLLQRNERVICLTTHINFIDF